ncbi:MAG: hypothetical protein KF752_02895 [Pirellulaceae bacterium]|nr:hypothetical protein [Pirellulaceae bacterium]
MTQNESDQLQFEQKPDGLACPGESGVRAIALVTELIDHVHSEIKDIDDILDWNKKVVHRNPTHGQRVIKSLPAKDLLEDVGIVGC